MPWTFRVHRLYARWHSEGMGRGCSSLPQSSLEGSSGYTTGASQNHYCPSRDPTLASAGNHSFARWRRRRYLRLCECVLCGRAGSKIK